MSGLALHLAIQIVGKILNEVNPDLNPKISKIHQFSDLASVPFEHLTHTTFFWHGLLFTGSISYLSLMTDLTSRARIFQFGEP